MHGVDKAVQLSRLPKNFGKNNENKTNNSAEALLVKDQQIQF